MSNNTSEQLHQQPKGAPQKSGNSEWYFNVDSRLNTYPYNILKHFSQWFSRFSILFLGSQTKTSCQFAETCRVNWHGPTKPKKQKCICLNRCLCCDVMYRYMYIHTTLFFTHPLLLQAKSNCRVPTTSPQSPFPRGPIQTRSKHQQTTLTMKNSMGKSTDLHCHMLNAEEWYGNRMERKGWWRNENIDSWLSISWSTTTLRMLLKFHASWVSSKESPIPKKYLKESNFASVLPTIHYLLVRKKLFNRSTTPLIHPNICHRRIFLGSKR